MSAVVRYSVALLSVLCAMMLSTAAWANDIAVSSIMLTGQNTSSDFTFVRFNLSWENSWRFATGPSNWDAAWVFVKFRVGGSNTTFTGRTLTNGTATVNVPSTTNLRVGMPVRVVSGSSSLAAGTVITAINTSTNVVTLSGNATTTASNNTLEFIRIWEHARLNNTGHTLPSGSTFDAGLLTPGSAYNASTNPCLGVFIYRSSVGVGNNAFNNIQLRWNYGDNTVADDAVISVQVFAIEMVYVPGGRRMTLAAGAVGTFGFNAIDGNVTITDPNAFVVDNADLWIANNNNTPRSLRWYTAQNTAGAFPAGNTRFVAFVAPNSTFGNNNNTYTLPDRVGAAQQVLRLSAATATTGTMEWVDGVTTVRTATVDVTADNQAITAAQMDNITYLRLSSNGAPATRTITLANGATSGHRLIIRCVAGAGNGIEIEETANVELNGAFTLEDRDAIMLVWDAANTLWVELSRSNN
jgi:hypothetical protein